MPSLPPILKMYYFSTTNTKTFVFFTTNNENMSFSPPPILIIFFSSPLKLIMFFSSTTNTENVLYLHHQYWKSSFSTDSKSSVLFSIAGGTHPRLTSFVFVRRERTRDGWIAFGHDFHCWPQLLTIVDNFWQCLTIVDFNCWLQLLTIFDLHFYYAETDGGMAE